MTDETALARPNRTPAVHATTPKHATGPTGRTARTGRIGPRTFAAYLPVLVLAALVLTSLVRTGTAGWDITRYAGYWVVAIILPGKVVTRALLGVRRTVIEDLSLAAVTGVSLEILAWVVGVVTGIGSIARFWWVPVLLAGLLVPALQGRVLMRSPERMKFTHSAALAVIAWLILMQLDLTGFRFAPIPPRAGGLFADQWWHAGLVQEMMKYEKPQTPQAAGLTFHYHYFADVQMASGARLTGVAPEVILLRLWIVPAVLLCVGLGFTLGRALTRSAAGGVLSSAVMFAVPSVAYLWPGVGTFAPSVFLFISPSQVMADFGVVVSALAVIMLLRAGPSPRLVVWSALVVVGNSGDKATVIPIVAAGAVVALLRAAYTRSREAVRLLGAAVVVLAVVGIVIFSVAAGTTGGKPIVLGTLRAFPVFTELVPTPVLRGVNNGLVLDSIDSPRAVAIAILATIVILGLHGVRLIGIAGLARRHLRDDLVVWFLAAAVVAGYGATLSFEQIGFSQSFFAATAAPLGAALTVYFLHDSVTRSAGNKRLLLLTGVLLGCGTALVIKAAIAIRGSSDGYHALERMLLPPVVLVVIAALSWVAWRRVRHGWNSDGAWALVLAAALGLAIPNLVTSNWKNIDHWVQPVHYQQLEQAGHVKSGELKAMLWLRDHSGADDVVMADAQCLPANARVVSPHTYCSARGFWVSGLSGRRVVLDGWAYTPEAAKGQGVGGRTYAFQPSPFKERYELNQAVFDKGDVAALQKLRKQYGVRWIVAVDRAGPPPTLPSSVARVRFDNGQVKIFEVPKETGTR